MDGKQYNNVIDWTLTHDETVRGEDSLTTARTVFKNMGVALPQGDMKQVYDTISTDDYMGWRSCMAEEAQAAANKGTAAIGISEEQIVVLSAEEDETVAATFETAAVMTLSADTEPAVASELQYYAYSYDSTTTTATGIAGVFSIFASDGPDSGSLFSNFGHAFVSFRNTSNLPVTIGGLTVQTLEEITFGTWGHYPQHKGIWYNLESYLIYNRQQLADRVSLTMIVMQDDIEKINTVIAENDTWSEVNNCSTFAVKVWNEVSDTTLTAGTILSSPAALMSSIESEEGYETGRYVHYNKNAENIGYLSGEEFVYVTIAD